ncbi:DUF4338 domain-containing protein [Thermodesulfovibrionales bacterium]|nr:DUF4338 domain-containing protein [Thermodesulfovibrionales bacterium]
MLVLNQTNLKDKVMLILKKQGYRIKHDGVFVLKNDERETKRRAHDLAKAERIASQETFILEKTNLAKSFLIDGKNLKIQKIKPEIIEVEPGTEQEDLFRWWNLIWWSLPYERGYGRQMRFIIWDEYHNAPIGLIGLQSPILSWSVRDNYLGISPNKRDFWVNQSLNAQRIGALPPYNDILGGKLVALLMTSNVIRRKFQSKYENKKTILKKKKLPSRLLFITTTGAYGKSSVYTRLKFHGEEVAKFIGYTQGSGTFHVPNALYEDLVLYLQKRGYDVRRGYGSGPSRKLRLIDQALRSLGFMNGAAHGIQRAVYLFSLTKNLKSVVQKNKRPIWVHRTIDELTDFWKDRWGIPRAKRNSRYLKFAAEKFIQKTLQSLQQYKRICRII